MKKYCVIVWVAVNVLLLISCGGSGSGFSDSDTDTQPASISFGEPSWVVISGYNGDAMEPFISRDGNILFFNNLNSGTLPGGGENDTGIHYAVRIDDVTFQYMGAVVGADTDNIAGTNELEAVASIDKNNRFYFVRTIDYLTAGPDYLSSIFSADYVNGTLVNIQSLPNMKNNRLPGQAPVPGELNFDAEIHYDGGILYFVEGIFSGDPIPVAADIGVAVDIDGEWIVDPDSERKLALVNTAALEYAPSISSDRLELYFTRATGSAETGFEFGIYVATRDSVTEPWSHVRRIESIRGDIPEAPSISYDGSLLYFHKKVGGVYRIYVANRELL